MPSPLRVAGLTFCAALTLTNCAHRAAPGLSGLDEAEARASETAADARSFALSGFRRLLVKGDIATSVQQFDQALKIDPREPWAHFGHLTVARIQTEPKQSVAAALEILANAPQHPLAELAAQHLFETVGFARSTDQLIEARGEKLLSLNVNATAAFTLRIALARLASLRHDTVTSARLFKAAGVVTEATLLGPFSAFHHLETVRATAPERAGEIALQLDTPTGKIAPRTLRARNGQFSLTAEPDLGDVYLLSTDVELQDATTLMVRVLSDSDFVASINGTPLLARLTTKQPASLHQLRAIRLEAGRHRLMVRLSKNGGPAGLTLAVSKAFGDSLDIAMTASKGPPPAWGLAFEDADLPAATGTAFSLSKALELEAGEGLASAVSAAYSVGYDQDGARAQVNRLLELSTSAWPLLIRAEVERSQPTNSPKLFRGRAARDLEAAVQFAPSWTLAHFELAQMAVEDGRPLDAIDAIAAVVGKPTAPLLALRARAQAQAQQDANALKSAESAEQTLAGMCESNTVAYEVARRTQDKKLERSLLTKLDRCPDSLWLKAQSELESGQPKAAIETWLSLLSSEPRGLAALPQLVNALLSLHQEESAIALLNANLAQFPRQPAWLKLLAEAYESKGLPAQALSTRQRALALDGGDLTLRRQVSRATTGAEPLAEFAISTEEALKNYAASAVEERTTSSYVLDAAAVRVFADGSQVERIHEIRKALDQNGVQAVAEVNLPAGAQVLTLRTLKSDGSTFEPEGIEGKESMSLPAVQVGDMVETEYLRAIASRTPEAPGFTASNFYFQVVNEPNHWSSYVVAAPKALQLRVDAHHLKTAQPTTVGSETVFRHEARRVAPFFPEPLGPPTGNEFVPFVSVGAKTLGNTSAVLRFGDDTARSAQFNRDIATFAHNAAQDAVGLSAVERVYSAVKQRIAGPESSLLTSASDTLAEQRGSRAALLVASLRSLQIDARFAVVRSFQADPAPYLFPNGQLLPYLCVVVTLPSGETLWLDTATRFAPFNQLPDHALGGRQAFLLPEAERGLVELKTPTSEASVSRALEFNLTLSQDGSLTGTGIERYTGFESAVLAESLEAVPQAQRDLALQTAFSRYFGGAELSKVEVKAPQTVGSTVEIRYAFKSPRFAKPEQNGQLVFSALTPPAMLGRRYVSLSERASPLFIEATESSKTTVTLSVPPGFRLSGAIEKTERLGPEGSVYRRRESQTGSTIQIEESLRLSQARLTPRQYGEFVPFAGDVDLFQQRDMILTPTAPSIGPVRQ